jgi:tocopherol cyclase
MLNRLKSVWRPENFHLHHMLGRGKPCFEGWYFKLVDANGMQPYAIIPGVFLGADAHAFIQVLDGRAGTSSYHRFPLSEFHADSAAFDVRIGRSRFSRAGISLDIAADEINSQRAVQGDIRFGSWSGWPVTWTSPGVMGPYSFVPFMECNHGILSMDHPLDGELDVDGVKTTFDGGRGYIEKDWGQGFPSGYAWMQSNHFDEPGTSISASVARIPWLTGSFRGYLIGFLLRGKLHRFTTYTGAKIEHIEVTEQAYSLSIRDRKYRLEVSATRTDGAILHAPYEKQMIERVAETMTSTVDLRFKSVATGETLFEDRGEHGCLEVQGDIQAILSP